MAREVIAGLTTFLTMSYIVVVNPAIYARLPFGVAPGITFWSGVLFLLVSVTPLREQIALAIPDKLDVWGAFKLSLVPAIVTVVLTDLFDSLATFIGVSQAANLVDDKGRPKNLRQGLIVDSFATLGAGLFGSSAGTTFVESIAGIRMGGRTGMTAVVTAFCFLPCLFIAPMAAAIPSYATSGVLILVGVSMFQAVTRVPFDGSKSRCRHLPR